MLIGILAVLIGYGLLKLYLRWDRKRFIKKLQEGK